MDKLTKEQRSRIMSSIKSKNTKPEILVRSLLHSMGYRFRIHKKDLPGSPDIYLKKYNAVIFVNGCFWHQHKNCKHGHIPKTNTEYWIEKLERNVERDQKNYKLLNEMGIHWLVIWECEIDVIHKEENNILVNKLRQFLENECLNSK